MKASVAMTKNAQHLILEIMPALQGMFHLGFIPDADDFVELTDEEYKDMVRELGDYERPVYAITSNNPAYDGKQILPHDAVEKMKRGADFLAKYAQDQNLNFQNQQALLEHAAKHFPTELSKGTPFEQPELKVVDRHEPTKTKRETWMDFLDRYLTEDDYLSLQKKDENGVTHEEIIAPGVEKNFKGEKLNYEAFKQEAMAHIRALYPEERYEVVTGISKSTDEVAHEVIQVKESAGDLETHSGIRVAQFYKDYSLGKPLEEVLDEMTRTLTEHEDLLQDFDPYDLMDFEKVKNRLIVRPLNFKSNQELLKDFVYRRYNDIALVIYAVIKHEGGDLMSSKVAKEVIETWNLSENELFDWAIANAASLYKPCVIPMDAFMRGETPESYAPQHKFFMEPGFVLEKDRMNTYNLFLDGNINAATAVFYKGALKQLAAALGDDLYLVIASMSFVVVHPKRSIPLNQVKRFAKEEKRNPYANPAEFLSDGVYFYNRREDSLRIMHQ